MYQSSKLRGDSPVSIIGAGIRTFSQADAALTAPPKKQQPDEAFANCNGSDVIVGLINASQAQPHLPSDFRMLSF